MVLHILIKPLTLWFSHLLNSCSVDWADWFPALLLFSIHSNAKLNLTCRGDISLGHKVSGAIIFIMVSHLQAGMVYAFNNTPASFHNSSLSKQWLFYCNISQTLIILFPVRLSVIIKSMKSVLSSSWPSNLSCCLERLQVGSLSKQSPTCSCITIQQWHKVDKKKVISVWVITWS